MALRTARRLVVRGRPTGRAAGRIGPTQAKPRRSRRCRRIECSSYGPCAPDQCFFKTDVDFSNIPLTRIFHTPVKNAHRVPTFVGVSREGFRPGKLLPKQLATGEHFTSSSNL